MSEQLRAALRAKKAAQYLDMGIATLWRRAKCEPDTFPQPHRIGPGTTVWLVKDLDAFLDRCARG
jgi:predicted DNA-binding transcriptional regulator AlpA